MMLFCGVFGASESSAWSETGHQLTCEVAETALTANARRQISGLMQALPEAQQQTLYENRRFKFADLCTWADQVRPLKIYDGVKSWHYINVNRWDSEINLDQCIAGCVLTAIDTHVELLRNVNNKPWTRLQALMFVSHWVGDVHQPLHVSFADDYGGNKVRVLGFDGCDNLHGVWDYCLVRDTQKNRSELLQDLLAIRFDERALTGGPIDWAQESFELVTHPRVQYCRQQSGACVPWASQRYRLSPAYHATNWPIAERRLAQAGFRLAKLLNRVLSPETLVSTP
jgi:hypothetical protein